MHTESQRPTDWMTITRPGYFGAERDIFHAQYDSRYGPGSWRLIWDVNDCAFTREQMTMLYEDSYYEFLKANPAVLDQLVAEAYDVYDDARSNIRSGLDYKAQETGRTHVQDIAIRRAVVRHGRHFQGDQLIQIRDAQGEHPLSVTLSPGQVPFHMPELLWTPELTGWWQPGSVESFYQSNKLLQVRQAVFDRR